MASMDAAALVAAAVRAAVLAKAPRRTVAAVAASAICAVGRGPAGAALQPRSAAEVRAGAPAGAHGAAAAADSDSPEALLAALRRTRATQRRRKKERRRAGKEAARAVVIDDEEMLPAGGGHEGDHLTPAHSSPPAPELASARSGPSPGRPDQGSRTGNEAKASPSVVPGDDCSWSTHGTWKTRETMLADLLKMTPRQHSEPSPTRVTAQCSQTPLPTDVDHAQPPAASSQHQRPAPAAKPRSGQQTGRGKPAASGQRRR
mmetsp:Transcript_49181/g.138846  ORF Transcript_49181/g.138846 Transcript_49181/m.138846 type:complete len:260 (-) Transcript_49181:158-937(-)